MKKIRVYELAKELNIPAKEAVSELNTLGFWYHKLHMAALDDDSYQLAKEELSKKYSSKDEKKEKAEENKKNSEKKEKPKQKSNSSKRNKEKHKQSNQKQKNAPSQVSEDKSDKKKLV